MITQKCVVIHCDLCYSSVSYHSDVILLTASFTALSHAPEKSRQTVNGKQFLSLLIMITLMHGEENVGEVYNCI